MAPSLARSNTQRIMRAAVECGRVPWSMPMSSGKFAAGRVADSAVASSDNG
jgi:hypothetical protein